MVDIVYDTLDRKFVVRIKLPNGDIKKVLFADPVKATSFLKRITVEQELQVIHLKEKYRKKQSAFSIMQDDPRTRSNKKQYFR